MPYDCVFLSSVDDIEADFLSDVSELSVHDCLISADNVGGLVSISDWEGVL